MQKVGLYIATAFLWGAMPVMASAHVKRVNSEINAVTVYLSGAYISRSASFSLAAGTTELLFEGLPASLNQQSISARGHGRFTILSVEHRLEYLGPDNKPDALVSLEDSLESLNFVMGGLSNRMAVLNEEQSMILANKSVGGTQTGVTAAELARVADYLRTRLTQIKAQLLNASVEERKLKESIDKVKAQLAVIRSHSSQPTGTVLVTVSAEGAVAAKMELSYAVQEASWMPFYDMRSDGNGPVQLSYRAHVTQRTGEDWKNVDLSLSTGNPALPGTKPTLFPWFLNFYQPVLLKQRYGGSAESSAARPTMDESDTVTKALEAADLVSLSENRLNTAFRIEVPYSVASDGKAHAVTILNRELPATYSYAVVPKLDETAFLLAAITGWHDLGLLPGSAFIYFEGSYTGRSHIDPFIAEDTLLFSFGRDQRVVVKRKEVLEFSSARLLGGSRHKALGYEITLKNTMKQAVKLTLEDQLPVSKNKEIEVRPDELSGGLLNEETGLVTWKLLIGAGETVSKRLLFTVKYPKDKAVGGL